MTLQKVSESRSFGGVQQVWSHPSSVLGCTMRFGLYLPPQAAAGRVPVLWWLSGLTCTEENFVAKAGAQRVAAELGLALVAPDTSPRGVPLPGDAESWDFGVGAGWYVDATEAPWSRHYRMRAYLVDELRAIVEGGFPVDGARTAMSGHSMGGHGALTIALSRPDWVRSVSAFAPVASTTRCPWGEKALSRFLGADRAAWAAYDASELVRSRGWAGPPILVDQGGADPFLESQLKPELLERACADARVPLELRRHDGYDHGYFFVSTFVEDHLRRHRAAV
ncbi:MAG TPA: S-formylglutathione hydrolase [Burkholderiaceae bacterium]|nr:S-formylglutathione hydrolase [Burkholderiaceae bacterium]